MRGGEDVSRDPDPPTGPVRFAVTGGPAALRPAAERAADAAVARGAVGAPRDALVLAIHELLANALEHGHLGDATIPVVVEVAVSGAGALTVRVEDRARGGAWHRTPPPAPPAPSLAERGRGLGLARAGSHRLRVLPAPDRTVVALTVRCAPEGRATPPDGRNDAG